MSPYIDPDDRRELHEWPAKDVRPPQTSGELNYLISDLIDQYIIANNKSYDTINDVLGALEGAKLEFYRRAAAPYEDVKARLNGDVFSPKTLETPRG